MIKFQAANRLLSRLPGPLGTALLLYLAFSSSDFAFCIWFAFIPLFRSIRKRPPLQALIQGLISGFIFYYFNLFWITNSIRNFSTLPLPLVWLVLALLAIYLSLYFGLFSLLLAISPVVSWFSTLFLASSWALLEWLRGTLLVGFPWNNLGITITPASAFSLLLSYGGIYTLSFLIMYTNLALYALTSSRKKGPPVRRRQAAALLALPALYFLLLAGGSHAGADNLDYSRPITINIIQPNIPQSEKWDSQKDEQIRARLGELTETATRLGGIDLVIWPETALPDFVRVSRPSSQLIYRLAKLGSPLLEGTMDVLFSESGRTYFNSSILYGTNGVEIAKYDKQHLVPFGEYVPMEGAFGFVRGVAPAPIGDFSPGKRFTLFD